MQVSTVHSVSFLDLIFIEKVLGLKEDVSQDDQRKTQSIGDYCTLTFLEHGYSLYRDDTVDYYYEEEYNDQPEHNYKVKEELFHVNNDVLLLKERDHESHSPIMVTLEPSDMKSQEQRSFLVRESLKQRAKRGRPKESFRSQHR